ncbi:hypothetical protein BLNAU_21351 [Blattamonas nauphoetae]|uniref:Uncharacterized protein n=1 Tax=Blattamonas nauphoetae TaxID=2049346 RepID=A0ABQ9WW75_9EUKA|nr:hypothetical protein BLNAU_21351 [Blattamonas nauphoetae]
MPSPSTKEIGAIGIDLAAVRREMEAERVKEKEEFVRKMREMEEMKKANEELIEEGRQRREEERMRKEEEERRRNVKEGAVAIEVFAQDKFTVSGNMFTKSVTDFSSLFSHSFGPVIVRITFVIRKCTNQLFLVGLIAPNMVEQATPTQGWFANLKGAAGWEISPSFRYVRQNGKEYHKGTACKVETVGQRVVIEADGREGKRTVKLAQDGETQPVFFSNIPVPFRFGIQMHSSGDSVEIVSSEVLKEPAMVGGSLKVVMD